MANFQLTNSKIDAVTHEYMTHTGFITDLLINIYYFKIFIYNEDLNMNNELPRWTTS